MLEPDPNVIWQYHQVVIQAVFAKGRKEPWHGLVLSDASIVGRGCGIPVTWRIKNGWGRRRPSRAGRRRTREMREPVTAMLALQQAGARGGSCRNASRRLRRCGATSTPVTMPDCSMRSRSRRSWAFEKSRKAAVFAAMMLARALEFWLGDGSSSARLHGLDDVAAWPRIGTRPSPP